MSNFRKQLKIARNIFGLKLLLQIVLIAQECVNTLLELAELVLSSASHGHVALLADLLLSPLLLAAGFLAHLLHLRHECCHLAQDVILTVWPRAKVLQHLVFVTQLRSHTRV